MSSKIPATDLEYIRSRYLKRISEHGVSFASMNSGTEEKQKIRHGVHASIVGKHMSVLDVGCGIGQFYENLLSSGFEGRYVGIDIVPDYIDYCKSKYPQAEFHFRDVFEYGFEETYDVITASQVFNARYSQANNEAVLKEFLKLAFVHTRHGVSVDMLTSYADFNVKELFYFNPEEVFSFSKGLSRLVALRHDYLPFEFCLQVMHQK